MGNREAFLDSAINAIGNNPRIMIVSQSSYYETTPVGEIKQANFINAAVNISTTMTPLDLLATINQIEQDFHRKRDVHWGPRTLDIDIIFWGTQQINEDNLVVPHPEAFNRLFVLAPASEVLPKEFAYYNQIESTINSLKEHTNQQFSKIALEHHHSEQIQASVRTILAAIGDDPDRAGLLETPLRVAKMSDEIFSSTGQSNFTDYKLFQTDESSSSNMVMMRNIPFYSMCEHHMMPFFGKVHVAYIPNNGKIIGLSKIPRLVDFVTHKLGLQEKVTSDILSQLNQILEPKGVAVVVDARHMCVEMRGVKKADSTTRTFSFSGQFENDNIIKSEFLNSIGDLNDQSL